MNIKKSLQKLEEYFNLECNSPQAINDEVKRAALIIATTCAHPADLTTEEMSLSIDCFKDWSAQVAEIALPDADNEAQIAAAQVEVERNKRWI